jgi:hypothetical protein
MGCIQSNAAYPGNKRVAKPTYQPGANEFQQVNATTATATAHFITCPGGNALKLADRPNRAEVPSGSDGLAKYIQVTIPPGVNAGDIIHVKAPDGRMNAITVPSGYGPGSTFTVEFSSDDNIPPLEPEDLAPGVYVPTVMAQPELETGVPSYVPEYGGGVSYGSAVGGAVTATPTTGPYVPATYASKY